MGAINVFLPVDRVIYIDSIVNAAYYQRVTLKWGSNKLVWTGHGEHIHIGNTALYSGDLTKKLKVNVAIENSIDGKEKWNKSEVAVSGHPDRGFMITSEDIEKRGDFNDCIVTFSWT